MIKTHEYIGGSHDELNPCKAGRRTLWKGGSSSSSSSNATTTQNTDKRQVVDNQSVGVSSDSSTVTVNTLEPNAVAHALDLAGATEQGALDGYRALLAATIALNTNAAQSVKANTDLAQTLASQPVAQQTTARTTQLAMVVVAGVAAVILLKKKG